MESKKYLHLPYFEVVLSFPIEKIVSKNETHSTIIYRAWGVTSETTVPNEWIK